MNKKYLPYVAVLFLVAITAAIAIKVFNEHSTKGEMRFEVVATPQAREKGLSGREEVPDNYGMLFVFDTPERYSFWMKDMLVPIDIIWLAEDGTIVKIDASVATSTYPTTFLPPVPVRHVLETRAGYAKDHGWTAGVKIELP